MLSCLQPVLRKMWIARERDGVRACFGLSLKIWLAYGTLMPALMLRAVGVSASDMQHVCTQQR
jgi:hypothetical protein